MPNNQCVHLMIYVVIFLLFPSHSPKLFLNWQDFKTEETQHLLSTGHQLLSMEDII